MIEEALKTCRKTMETKIASDPDGERRKIIAAFDSVGVSVEQIEKYLKHPLKESSPTEIATLIQIGKSIKDGNSTWNEYLEKKNNVKPDVKMPEAKKSIQTISAAQVKRLHSIATANKYTEDYVKHHIKDIYKLESSKDILVDDYDDIVNFFSEGMDGSHATV